jgi:hypothetical protein
MAVIPTPLGASDDHSCEASRMTQPWMKFFGSDWCGDQGLRSCSLAARGLWLEMLLVMDRSEPRGSLLLNGKQIDARRLASIVGADKRDVETFFRELDEAGVFSRDTDGTVFSRKMRRDEARAERDKRSGEMGGHPEIRRGTVPKADRVRRFRKSDAPEKAQRVYDRDSGNCHWCGKPLGNAYHIDHVVAVRDGGGNEEENLVAACPDCNGRRAMTWGPTPTQYEVGKERAVMVGNSSDHKSDPKAQKLEARSQRLEAAQPSSVRTEAASQREEKQKTLEQRCRQLVGDEPVSADPAFVFIGDLIGTDGIVEADLIAAVTDAMADATFRIKYWKQLINWVRKAAQKRLESKPKTNGHANGATPDDPEVDLGPVKDRQSKIVNAIQKIGWAGYAGWAETEFGSVEYFRSAVASRAPHLLKFWPAPPATDPSEPALAAAK